MSFMMKKKKFKFLVKFEVEELASVPFISGILFCKIRLIDGGTLSQYSSREEVRNHTVKWNAQYTYQCKMVANPNTGVLESCLCRVSVRKEIKGGKSYQKLGYADVDLAEFAGSGSTSRRYILEGYDSKRRQDNSVLKINIDMSLLSGDPLFKVPASKSMALSTDLVEELQPENKGGDLDHCTESLASAGSSGFGSLPRKVPSTDESPEVKTLVNHDPRALAEDAVSTAPVRGTPGHTRTCSSISTQSKGSGYSSTESRNSSVAEEVVTATHRRSSSAGSLGAQVRIRNHARQKLDTYNSIERRVDATRVNADDLVNELIASTDFDFDESAETSGLQLYVGKDGQAIIGGQHDKSQIAAGNFERVVIDKR